MPAQAHRVRPDGVPAQGFTTGVAGGGRLGELVLTDLRAGDEAAGTCGTGGCCAG